MYFKKEWIRPSDSMVLVLLFFTFGSLVVSCRKGEGTGGTGSISGTLIEHYYNDDYSRLIYQNPAIDEEVYILYGDDNVLGDRIFTSNTGAFRFEFLYPGHYSIYYLSRDSASILDEDQEKMVQVDLGRGENVELGSLEKFSTLDYDDGAAVIKGVVKAEYYVKGSNTVIDYVDFAHEHEVYLTYGNHSFYDERVRTQYNGYFEFSNLIPGDYLVFLYSDDATGETEHEVLKFEMSITELDQVENLGEITIKKL